MSIPTPLTDALAQAQALLATHTMTHKDFLSKILDHLSSLNTQTSRNKYSDKRVTNMMDSIRTIKGKMKFLMDTVGKGKNLIRLFRKSNGMNLG